MVRFRCICRGSQKRVHDPTSRFPPLAPAGRCSPASAVLSRRYDFLTPIPPRFVSFAWWYLNVHSLSSLPGGRVRRQSLELVTRFSSRDLIEETTGPPKFLENPNCLSAHVQSTPAGLLAPDQYGTAAWPLVCEQQRLPRWVFRRSIAWLSDSLSTLRRAGYPTTTQDSLPAAGQALPDGLPTRRVPTKGLKVASLHLIPLSQALLGAITST